MASLGTIATAVPRDASEQTTIIPHTQKPLVTRVYPTASEVDQAISKAASAQDAWKRVPLEEKIALGRKFIVSPMNVSSPS
jgi:acyl-CoA reductase-like NAD-dependent aldehyde dehydrogenase